MRVIYHIPSTDSIYAGRFIYEGYKNAFIARGHEFQTFSSGDDVRDLIEKFEPDLFISSLNLHHLKYLDLEFMAKRRKDKGMALAMQVPPWKQHSKQYQHTGLSENHNLLDLISKNLAGDIFFNWIEADDPCMEGFKKATGRNFHTVLLAADTDRFYPEKDLAFDCDICYVGSNLPDKRDFLEKHLLPLEKIYKVKKYGNDWSLGNRALGIIQKGSQYFNIPHLKGIRKLALSLTDEHKLYSTAKICLNIHEDHQRTYGTDFNERTLKIIASGGFEICDNVEVLKKYFSNDELVIARNTDEWFDLIKFYLNEPGDRLKISQKGREKVLQFHTYVNRVDQFEDLVKSYKG